MTALWSSSIVGLAQRAIAATTTDTADLWNRSIDKIAERREWKRPKCHYESVPNWDQRLHSILRAPFPCPICAELNGLWTGINDTLVAAGIPTGPQSFGPWNDGDAGLVRAAWSLTRHLQPQRVVETGVAHGLTSRVILEAMARNGSGHLSSIDLPPVDIGLRQQVGAAVSPDVAGRWTYILGSSRRRLPGLLSRLGQIDLFVHDSLHSERNVRFELDRAWHALRPGGAALIDDIDANWGFHSFNEAFPGHPHLVCEAEPLRADPRRFNGRGLFGIILKMPSA
jgi:Methyltransferase domain